MIFNTLHYLQSLSWFVLGANPEELFFSRAFRIHINRDNGPFGDCLIFKPGFDSGISLGMIVANLFHPVDSLAIELLLNGNVRQGSGRRSPMPVLLTRREPNHITGPDLLDWAAPPLHAATSSRDDEHLPEGMRMPCGPRAWLEGYAGTLNKCRIGCLKKWIDSYRTSEPLRRPLGGRL